jgi:hypothetical protein
MLLLVIAFGNQSLRRTAIKFTAMIASAAPHTVGIPGGIGRTLGSEKINIANPNARCRKLARISPNVTRSPSE